ncbi:hypothetical protein QAD02_011974 [Eretmocerus hayati]|uniref:Uncharacterized protein n=1 Tax=Eretmocerus hayati TaxID=131215 RepID=A0ACC2NZ87_9HYME|nr:hypothetical protein QAD02_011974 [Eretmocerus hayati]
MQHPWRYFQHTPRRAAEVFIALLQPTPTIYGYVDDVSGDFKPGALHGAVNEGPQHEESARVPANIKNSDMPRSTRSGLHQGRPWQDDDIVQPRPQENTGDPVKKENSATAARKEERANVRLSSVRTINCRETGPIKGPENFNTESVRKQSVTHTDVSFIMESVSRKNPSPRPRRWLVGAPGGWWPSDIESESSDEETSAQGTSALPLKKRKLWSTSRTPSASSESITRGCEPQSSFLAHGSQQPQEVTPILPHGPSNSEPEPGRIIESLNQSFGSLSTQAVASDNENFLSEGHSAPSSSSSAYGSDVDESEAAMPTARITSRGEGPYRAPPSPARLQPRARNSSPPSVRQRRKTRAEHAARNAAWSNSVVPPPAVIEVVNLVTSDEDDSDCSDFQVLASDTVMHFEVQVYRAMCMIFEASRHPNDGAALIRYIQAEVTRGRERLRVKKWRHDKKKRGEAQDRQELRQAEEFVNEVANAIEDQEAQPGPSGTAKRKKPVPRRPRKKRAVAAQVPVPEEPMQFVLIEPPRAQEDRNMPALVPTPSAASAENFESQRTVSEVQRSSSPRAAEPTGESAATEAIVLAPSSSGGAGPSRRATSTPLTAVFGIAQALMGTPSTGIMAWTITPSANGTQDFADMDMSRFLEQMPPMLSPMATPGPRMAAAIDNELPPLSIRELTDDNDASLEIPPTPATPEHLRRAHHDCDMPAVHQAEFLSPRPQEGRPSIRMRIRRVSPDASPSSAIQEDDIETAQ